MADIEVVDVARLKAAVDAVAQHMEAHKPGPATTGAAPPQGACDLRRWSRDFMGNVTRTFAQKAQGVADAEDALPRTEQLLQELTAAGGGAPPARKTVRAQCEQVRDAAVAEAVLRHMRDYRATVDALTTAHAQERQATDAVHDKWQAHVDSMVARRRGGVDKAMGDLRQQWDALAPVGGPGAANPEAHLSDRILRFLAAGGAPVPVRTQVRMDLDRERLAVLDREVRELTERATLHPHERDELLSLLRRRTQLVDKQTTVPLPDLGGGGPEGPVVGETLRVAQFLEAQGAGIEAVAWRLRDVVDGTVAQCREAQGEVFRRNLDDARQRALAALEQDLATVEGTVAGHLERLRQHETREALPETAAPWRDVRADLARDLVGVL